MSAAQWAVLGGIAAIVGVLALCIWSIFHHETLDDKPHEFKEPTEDELAKFYAMLQADPDADADTKQQWKRNRDEVNGDG